MVLRSRCAWRGLLRARPNLLDSTAPWGSQVLLFQHLTLFLEKCTEKSFIADGAPWLFGFFWALSRPAAAPCQNRSRSGRSPHDSRALRSRASSFETGRLT